MLMNQHAKFYTRLALLFLISCSAILYYIIKKNDIVSLNYIPLRKQYLNNFTLTEKVENTVTNNLRVKIHPSSNKKFKSFSNGTYRYGSCSEEIKIAVVLCGDRLNQTIVTLKSAVIFSEKPLHFLIIVDENNRIRLQTKILEWPVDILDRLSFEFHPINFPNGSEGDEWKKLFKLCACQRLFLPSLLHHIDSLIYVDTDVLFLRPVEKLWKYFFKMNESHIAALCPEHEDFATGWYNRFARHPFYEPLGVNSGVMLMNLTRMRLFQWETYLPPIMKEYKLNIVWGDQDIINIIFHFHPKKLYIFPCEWNYRPDHCMYSSVCKTAEKNGVAVIHGNRGVFQNIKQPAFRAIYNAMLEFSLGGDVTSQLLVPVKEYLFEAVNTNCGKYLTAIFAKNFMFNDQEGRR